MVNMEPSQEWRRREVTEPTPETSNSLKEIANRLKKLSFRDMSHLSEMIARHIHTGQLPVTEAILAAADKLEAI